MQTSQRDEEFPSPGYPDPDAVAAHDAIGRAISDFLRLLARFE